MTGKRPEDEEEDECPEDDLSDDEKEALEDLEKQDQPADEESE